MTAEPTFVSYAQNMEDVVLSRLVSLVPHGRFIDVGAGHPTLENVTYGLYLLGWRGINVEPMQTEVGLLREVRPDDETIQAAVGATIGSVTLFEAPAENRGATTSNAELAARYAETDGEPFIAFESTMVTLASLLARFEPGTVHVVKVDVEGMEFDVLTGADLAHHRPWVLVVEATQPNDPTGAAHLWEHIVLEAGYRCVLFDGLNRFYVRTDLDDVANLLSVPANVFDRWVPAPVFYLQERFVEAETYAKALENVVADLRATKKKKRNPVRRSRTESRGTA